MTSQICGRVFQPTESSCTPMHFSRCYMQSARLTVERSLATILTTVSSLKKWGNRKTKNDYTTLEFCLVILKQGPPESSHNEGILLIVCRAQMKEGGRKWNFEYDETDFQSFFQHQVYLENYRKDSKWIPQIEDR